jgi:DNA-binding MarR family transcriptional regulator
MHETYLKAILATVARQTFPPEVLAELVLSNVRSAKQALAYNLCDGDHTQAEIASITGLDKGSLSRSIARWIELGVVTRAGTNNELRPMHVYPLTKDYLAKKKGRKNG